MGKTPIDFSRVAIASPHSHARLGHSVKVVRKTFPHISRLDAVAMPCCVRQSLKGEADTCDQRYEDLGIWSAENMIQIWNCLNVKDDRIPSKDVA